jgi:hypothetical protein
MEEFCTTKNGFCAVYYGYFRVKLIEFIEFKPRRETDTKIIR